MIERLPDRGDYQHYIVRVGNLVGEVISLRDYVEQGINQMLNELRRAIPQ